MNEWDHNIIRGDKTRDKTRDPKRYFLNFRTQVRRQRKNEHTQQQKSNFLYFFRSQKSNELTFLIECKYLPTVLEHWLLHENDV